MECALQIDEIVQDFFCINISMQKVEFEIGERASTLDGENYKFTDGNFELYIFGDLVGIVRNEEVFNSKQAFDLLVNVIRSEEFVKLLRCSVGAFFVVLRKGNDIQVFASPASSGLNFAERDGVWFFSNVESEFFKRFGSREDVSEEMLFNAVFSNALSVRMPFNSIFKNVKRCSCGSFVQIVGGEAKVRSFLLKSKAELKEGKIEQNFKKDLEDFSFLMESTLKLLVDYYRDQKILLSKSGGIDSSVLLVALKRIGSNATVYHVPYHGLNDLTVRLAKEITAGVGFDLKIRDESKVNFESLVARARSGLGVIHAPAFFRFNHFTYDEGSKHVDLMGQNADSLYAIDTFAPCSIYTGLNRWIPVLKGVKNRIYYSEAFLNPEKRRFWIRFWPFKVSKTKMLKSFEDYLKSTAVPAGEHVVPLGENKAKNLSESLAGKVSGFKESYLYEPVLNMGREAFDDFEDFLVKNHLIRVLRWYRTIQNAPANYHNSAQFEGNNKIIPYSEGPIADFFLNYLLRMKDVFYIKRLSYAYFKKHVGRSYHYFARKLYPNFFVRLVRLPFLILKRRLKPEVSVNIQQFDEAMLILKQMIKPEEMYLSRFFTDPDFKEYAEALYKKFSLEDLSGLKKADMTELCRLVNVELFLRDVLTS